MDMVGRHRAAQNPHLSRRTDLAQQLAGTLADLSVQNLVSILRDPYQVILDVPHRVPALSVLRHISPLPPDREAEAYRLKGGGIKPGTWGLNPGNSSSGRTSAVL